jgi:hypothetical protein
MKRIAAALLLVAAVGLAASPSVQPFRAPKANTAKQEYDRAVAKAKAEFDRAVKSAGEKFAGVLQVCQTEATLANDLDAAMKYRQAKEAALDGPPAPPEANFGVWDCQFNSGDRRWYVIQDNFAASVNIKQPRHGRPVRTKVGAGFSFEDKSFDVFAIEGGKLRLDHYTLTDAMAGKPPFQTAVGERVAARPTVAASGR